MRQDSEIGSEVGDPAPRTARREDDALRGPVLSSRCLEVGRQIPVRVRDPPPGNALGVGAQDVADVPWSGAGESPDVAVRRHSAGWDQLHRDEHPLEQPFVHAHIILRARNSQSETLCAMRVHVGSDHAGLELKAHLTAVLTGGGHEVIDHGPFIHDALDDYPVFCLRAAEAVVVDRERGIECLGVVIGGSGNGEQIAANKVRGVRCALAWSDQTAALGREHNNANVVSVGGRMHSLADMTRYVEIFLTTPFSGDERHQRRIDQLTAYESGAGLPPLPESALGLGPDA